MANVDVVRDLLTAHEGKDTLSPIRAALKALGPDPQPGTVAEVLAKDLGWRYYADDIVWDMTATGVGGVSRGTRELALWWAVMAPAWEEHVYRVSSCEDVGDWVLTVSEVDAAARGNHRAKMTIAQIWQVKGGKVSVMRAFLSEEQARNAAEGKG